MDRFGHWCPSHQSQTDQSEVQQKASQFQPDQACAAYELESSLIHRDILFHQEWDASSDTSLPGCATWVFWIFFVLTVKWESCHPQSPLDIYEWECLLATATSQWPYLCCDSEISVFKEGTLLFHLRTYFLMVVVVFSYRGFPVLSASVHSSASTNSVGVFPVSKIKICLFKTCRVRTSLTFRQALNHSRGDLASLLYRSAGHY